MTRNLRSQINAEVCAIQALSVVSQFIAALAKCTVRVSNRFFQNCAQSHRDSVYLRTHINLYRLSNPFFFSFSSCSFLPSLPLFPPFSCCFLLFFNHQEFVSKNLQITSKKNNRMAAPCTPSIRSCAPPTHQVVC